MIRVLQLYGYSDCSDEPGCTKLLLTYGGVGLGTALFLYIAGSRILVCLVWCFPVTCGHRKCIFTGRSTKPLQEIVLLVDKEIPTGEQIQELRENASLYLNDIKTAFEKTMTTTTFKVIFSGSVIEGYGVPFILYRSPKECCSKFYCNINALYTDLDVMFCSVTDKACFSVYSQGNILVEPLVTETAGFTGFANLSSLTPGFEGSCVSSKPTRKQVKSAVENASVSNLPGAPCCCGMIELTPKVKLDSVGPAVKINIDRLLEADITFCIHCPEWPAISDWPSRPRYWPSFNDAQRILSLGCHLVAKPSPDDEAKTSWRFSFSVAEVELSKLVPETARKCFLALKIILKDHLQPVVPEIGSYHIKTIFLNTLEKIPVGFWVEDNIEECFLTLLTELRDALIFMKCPHHWFSLVNLFDIEESDLQRLAKKVERILKDPAPFILDDGCCCLSPCCFRVPQYNFNRRSSQQFLADYDEVTITVDGAVVPGSHGPEDHPVQLSPVGEDRSVPSLDANRERYSETPAGLEQLVVSLPPMDSNQRGPRCFSDEENMGSSGEAPPLVVCLPPMQEA